jgi:ubiquinone/menaquinone biosynthesis C-methylase UbiE
LPKNLKNPVPFLVKELPMFRQHRVKNVLDLGCGVGRHSVYLAKNGFDVVGIDISQSALRLAKSWAQKERLTNVALIRGTMTHLPFRDGVFDGVVSISVIVHALKKGIQRTIDETHRILKKNGVLFANFASVKDPRYGTGERVEKNTFRIWESFEGNRFKELHHFFTEQEAAESLACFAEARVEILREKPNYWKIRAIK